MNNFTLFSFYFTKGKDALMEGPAPELFIRFCFLSSPPILLLFSTFSYKYYSEPLKHQVQSVINHKWRYTDVQSLWSLVVNIATVVQSYFGLDWTSTFLLRWLKDFQTVSFSIYFAWLPKLLLLHLHSNGAYPFAAYQKMQHGRTYVLQSKQEGDLDHEVQQRKSK